MLLILALWMCIKSGVFCVVNIVWFFVVNTRRYVKLAPIRDCWRHLYLQISTSDYSKKHATIFFFCSRMLIITSQDDNCLMFVLLRATFHCNRFCVLYPIWIIQQLLTKPFPRFSSFNLLHIDVTRKNN